MTDVATTEGSRVKRDGPYGRPLMGSAPAGVLSVRLDPELHQALLAQSERDGRSPSDLTRAALRRYLEIP